MSYIRDRITARHYATPHPYDVMVYQEGDHYYAKDRRGNLICIDSPTACLQESVNYLAQFGNKIYIKSGIYNLNNNPVNINNLSNIIIDGDKPIIENTVITMYGQQYNLNMHNIVRNIVFKNSSLIIQNGYANLFENLEFYGGQIQIRLWNTEQWSEANWFRNINLFDPSIAGFVFDTPTRGTSSYANNRLDNIFINLDIQGSKGIVINSGASIDNVYMSNIRIWVNGSNIVGLYIDGDADDAKIYNIVFESFVPPSPTSLYAIYVDKNANKIPTIIKPIFYGNWTSKIYNPYYKWIVGQTLGKSTGISVPVGTNNTYGQPVYIADYSRFYGTIPTPRIRITWGGTFASGETVTVMIIFNYIDGGQLSITKSATAPGSYWLTYDDLLNLYPGNNMLQSIAVQAMSSASSTQVTVTVDALFG